MKPQSEPADAAAPVTISVVTSTLNALPVLRHTAQSILAQTCPGVQWIVVDGASKDGTVDWLAQLRAGQAKVEYLSEPDTGIYDALNKALPRIRGEWVIFMGAGDSFMEVDTLQRCLDKLHGLDAAITIAYGGVIHTRTLEDRAGVLVYERWRGLDGPWIAARPALPGHQGTFQRARLFAEGFRFDTRLRIAADNEIMLRELLAGRSADLDMLVARMPVGGTSTQRRNRLRMIAETILVNYRLGIFWRRPILQFAVLVSNLLKHPARLFRDWWR